MNNKPWSFSSFPEDFQNQVFQDIKYAVSKGESLQLVGAPGAGCSTLINLLVQSDKIQNKYFLDLKVNFVVLDASLLLERDPVVLYRLLLSLFGPRSEIPNDNVKLAQLLEDEVGRICKVGKLVVVIDHFQDLDLEELRPFFSGLSYIHSKYRPDLSFIFSTEKPYVNFSDMVNFSGLTKLVSANIVEIPRLNVNDSLWLIKQTEDQESINLNKNTKMRIIELSGGFPRTIKRLVEGMAKGFSLDDLLNNPAIYPALLVHLEELSEYENLVKDIPILSKYKHAGLTQANSETVRGVALAKELTKLEEKLLKHFLSRKNEITDRDSGITAIWGNSGTDVSDHAYDQIVHRLRNKLVNSEPMVKIKTVRGRGHKLICD